MLDEYDIIKTVTASVGKLPEGFLPIGDDVALIPAGKKGESVVLKCDMLVGRTDVPPTMSWRQAARKAVAMCVSDFSAKGVRPTAFMVSLGVRRGVKEAQVEELASGLMDASHEWDVKLVGGDTGEADDLVIDCLMVGFADSVVRRNGASPGELVVVTGPFGQTAAGLKILMEGARAEAGFKRAAISSVLTPKPRLGAGLKLARFLSSSIDSSDGLSISLHTLSEMSGVGIKLSEVPRARGLEEFASRNSLSADGLALYGGEEYEIVGTVKKERLEAAASTADLAGCDFRVIGETCPAAQVRGVVLPDGRKLPRRGWVHLRSKP